MRYIQWPSHSGRNDGSHDGRIAASGTDTPFVIGAERRGPAGRARARRSHFERVTILERDLLEDDAEPRRGVPQGRHAHALLTAR